MSGFGEGPAQIAIAVLAIAVSLVFTVRKTIGRYTPAIRSKVADLGKAADIADFQHNCHRQYNADAGHRLQLMKCFFKFYFFLYCFFSLVSGLDRSETM
jgi:uncharacterized membrane protein